jgi:hypothetical protein
MQIVTPTHSDQLPAALNEPGGNLLRPSQLAEHVNDINVAKAQLANPNVQDKGAVRQRMAQLMKRYEDQAPRPITDGAVKDRLAKEAGQLLEQILPGMLSQEEMRKNPAGSVDKHMRWERANKAKIMRWKKLQCVLNADNADPHTWDRDAANLERFRPHGAQDRLRTDAQIGGAMTYGHVPEENWAKTFGSTHPDTSALNQAKKVQAEIDMDPSIGLELPPEVVRPTSGRKPMSEERKKLVAANLARGREKQRLARLAQEKGV